MRTFVSVVIVGIICVAAMVARIEQNDNMARAARSEPSGAGERRMGCSDGAYSRSVYYRGKIATSEDNRDIVDISQDGYVKLVEGGFLWSGKQLTLRPQPDGTIKKEFLLNGREKPYDPDGQAFLSSTLPDLVRRGFGAEARVEVTFKSKGVDGVLSEISGLESNFAKRVYFRALLEHAKPTGATLGKVLAEAGKEIPADHELRQLLQTPEAETALADKTAASSYFEAASTIDNDHELANLMIDIGKEEKLDAIVRDPYFKTIEKIDNDHEHRRVLGEIVERAVVSPETMTAVLKSTDRIDNDHELATLLEDIAIDHAPQGAMREQFLEAVKGISSQFERERAMSALEGRPMRRN